MSEVPLYALRRSLLLYVFAVVLDVGFWGSYVGFWGSYAGLWGSYVEFLRSSVGFWGSFVEFWRSYVGFWGSYVGFWGSYVGFWGSYVGFWGSYIGNYILRRSLLLYVFAVVLGCTVHSGRLNVAYITHNVYAAFCSGAFWMLNPRILRRSLLLYVFAVILGCTVHGFVILPAIYWGVTLNPKH